LLIIWRRQNFHSQSLPTITKFTFVADSLSWVCQNVFAVQRRDGSGCHMRGLPIEPLEERRLLSSVRLAVVGDFSVDTQTAPTSDVSKLIAGWNPADVITVGDNNYPNGAASTIDANVGTSGAGRHEFNVDPGQLDSQRNAQLHRAVETGFLSSSRVLIRRDGEQHVHAVALRQLGRNCRLRRA
jgi:hypothetical protein